MTFLSNGHLRFAVAVGAGAFAALGQAPYDMPVLMLLGLICAIDMFRRSAKRWQAAAIGWGFGFGYFLHGWTWLVSPFMVDPERYAWMAPFALVLMCGGLALFWGLAFAAARWMSPRIWPLVFCLTAAELLRGYLFTGFPWGMFSQGLVNTWPGQGLAFTGPYGLTLVFIAAACCVVHLFARISTGYIVGAGFTALLAALLVVPFSRPDAPLGEATIRMVQPNAAQKDKWDTFMIPKFFERQLAFTRAAPASGAAAPDLILWAETAIPWPLDIADGALSQISFAAAGTPVVLGVQRRDGLQFYNSAVLLGPVGEVLQTYDKHHLVPFGEYMPFGDFLSNFGIRSLASQFGNGYSSGSGAALMDLGPLGQALPLICYEAVFARDVNAAPARPAFLMQLTNDAWFGKGQGPLQHLAQARMRAIEQGLPMARVANTGVSAMIDPWGRVTQSLGLNEAGFLDARLPLPRAPTLYSRWGELPVLAVLLIGLALCIMRRPKYLEFDPGGTDR
ncbi:apolipoprotein N-acyltransferase [Roseobacter sp. GAI101]|uniref:apolipoprotein N-acyltransferase n=1 Tax=Roseobacter sp. (strain GAI101) TaxID=391589 RepID=UPI0001871677|nr:apolipoprotein N-acyltransferase [Roseobacter sp. GAI101]EEB83167.1 apolipoprotein N-acyltransferase [Roseobacter sp. GAI101]